MKIPYCGCQRTSGPFVAAVLIMAWLLTANWAAADEQVTFVTPSENIECIYTPAGGTRVYMPVNGGPELSCDRVKPRYVRLVLGPTGPATIIRNVGDAACCGSEPVLEYGSSWTRGPFTCKLTRSGLACTREGKTPHGFIISNSAVKAY